MIRLGVAVKIMGNGGTRVRDGRRAPNAPHLSVSLLYLRDVLLYLAGHGIGCYRMAADLAPYLTHPAMPQFHHQIDECAPLLADVGALARQHGIRLTLHPGFHVALGSPDDSIATRAVAEVSALARLLDALGAGPDGTIVVHVGPASDGQAATAQRFARRFALLPEAARQRLALEPDEHSFDLAALLPLHQHTGAPLVFDTLHAQLHNPRRLLLPEALALALATWPPGVRPKIHLSSQRTEAHIRTAKGGAAQTVVPPRHGQHADFVNPFECAEVLRATHGLPPFDLMLEAKAADLAALRLRADLARFAPDVAAMVQ